MWAQQGWDPSEHKHGHFIAIPKGFSGKPPLHVLHSFIPRKTNNSGWSSKARFSNKQVPSNNFFAVVSPQYTHSSLKGSLGMIEMRFRLCSGICVTPFVYRAQSTSLNPRESLTRCFYLRIPTQYQYNLTLWGKFVPFVDNKPKNPMEVFVAFHRWKGDKRNMARKWRSHLPGAGDPPSGKAGHLSVSAPHHPVCGLQEHITPLYLPVLTSGEHQEMGGDNSKIYTWHLRLFLQHPPHTSKQNPGRLSLQLSLLPGTNKYPVLAIPMAQQDCLDTRWAALGTQPGGFRTPSCQMEFRAIK